MSKDLSTTITNHISRECTTLATCWRIIRRDGLVQGFTNHNQDIYIDGLKYEASTGFTASAFAQESGLSVKNLELSSAFAQLNSDGITKADLVGGLYDYAKVDIFLVNWQSPPASLLLDPPEHILMVRGYLGEVSSTNLKFTVEIRSLAQLLQQKIGTITTSGCRAVFGDSLCQKDLSGLTDNVTVVSVSSNRQFSIGSVRSDGFYDNGEITVSSGANNGIKAMVMSWASGVLQLYEPLPFAIAPGDSLTAIAGCNKTRGDCRDKYNNMLNFQGEPDISGEDVFLSGFNG